MNIAVLLMTFVQGLAAGICFDVATVKLPTRKRIGAVAYAQFARGNDLGNGLKVYPYMVVGGGVLLIALAVTAHLTSQPDGIRGPLYAAALASVGYLLSTAKAAPLMWSLRNAPDDPSVLAAKLDRFAFWHAFRTAFQLAAFIALLWVWA
jgi:hypothetical protein